MTSSVPPAPSPVKAPRDILQPPRVGENFDIYKVAECSPDRLRLKVPSGCMLLMALWWSISRASSDAAYSHLIGKPLVWSIVAALIAVASLLNMGSSVEVDRVRRRARSTRFFFSTTEHPTDRLQAVRIELKLPTVVTNAAAANKPASTPNTAPPLANRAFLTLVGRDDQDLPVEIKLGDTTLGANGSWPLLGATALHVARMLKLPLRIDGAVESASETIQRQIEVLRAQVLSK
jgi:hypothetical protein